MNNRASLGRMNVDDVYYNAAGFVAGAGADSFYSGRYTGGFNPFRDTGAYVIPQVFTNPLGRRGPNEAQGIHKTTTTQETQTQQDNDTQTALEYKGNNATQVNVGSLIIGIVAAVIIGKTL